MIVRARDSRATSGECSCCWPPSSSPSSSAGPPFTHRGSAMSTSSTPRSIAPLMSRNFLYVLIFSWPERSKVFRSFVVSKIWNRKATTLRYLFHVSGFFYYFSATINPILYNVMSLKYRWSVQNIREWCCLLVDDTFLTIYKVWFDYSRILMMNVRIW